MESGETLPFSSAFLNQLRKWKSNGQPNLTVACDVGGSGFRLRLSNSSNSSQFVDFPHLKAQTTEECISALNQIERYTTSIIPNLQVKASTIAVAGPINQNKAVITNWNGSSEMRTLSLNSLPRKLFPDEKSIFLNDLQAGAYGIIASHIKGTLQNFFEPLWNEACPKGPIVSNTRTAILAAGSGLGISLIVKSPLLPFPYVFPSELGHLQMPFYDDHQQLIQYISDELHEGKHAPEYEDIASGRGVPLVYKYFLNKYEKKIFNKNISSLDVAIKAKEGDKAALQTLLTHYQFLLRVAKTVSTCFNCDSVLLALDNQVKDDWFIQKMKKELYFDFFKPDQSSWVKNVRVYHQRKLQNFNLLATEIVAKQLKTNGINN